MNISLIQEKKFISIKEFEIKNKTRTWEQKIENPVHFLEKKRISEFTEQKFENTEQFENPQKTLKMRKKINT